MIESTVIRSTGLTHIAREPKRLQIAHHNMHVIELFGTLTAAIDVMTAAIDV